jgi:hypothetical protein
MENFPRLQFSLALAVEKAHKLFIVSNGIEWRLMLWKQTDTRIYSELLLINSSQRSTMLKPSGASNSLRYIEDFTIKPSAVSWGGIIIMTLAEF